jgi:hypothetical protein
MQFARRMVQDEVRYLKNQSSTTGVISHIEELKFRTVRKGRPHKKRTQVTLQSQKSGIPCRGAYTN